MTTVLRALALLLFCSSALIPLARAQDASEESASSNEPRIHGRPLSTVQSDVGPAPKYASKPPLSIAGLSAEQCAAFIPQLNAYREYANAKTLWNLRKITSIGTGYYIEVCKEADDAFDKAAGLANNNSKNKAFEAAADDAFSKGSACRKDFDALFGKECSDSKDAECEAASANKSQFDFLDDQNKRFKADLIGREKEQGQLQTCAKRSTQATPAAPGQVTPSDSATQTSSKDQGGTASQDTLPHNQKVSFIATSKLEAGSQDSTVKPLSNVSTSGKTSNVRQNEIKVSPRIALAKSNSKTQPDAQAPSEPSSAGAKDRLAKRANPKPQVQLVSSALRIHRSDFADPSAPVAALLAGPICKLDPKLLARMQTEMRQLTTDNAQLQRDASNFDAKVTNPLNARILQWNADCSGQLDADLWDSRNCGARGSALDVAISKHEAQVAAFTARTQRLLALSQSLQKDSQSLQAAQKACKKSPCKRINQILVPPVRGGSTLTTKCIYRCSDGWEFTDQIISTTGQYKTCPPLNADPR